MTATTDTLPPVIARGPGGRRIVVAPALTVEIEGSGPITRRQGVPEPDALPRVPGIAGGIDLTRYRGTPRKEDPMPFPTGPKLPTGPSEPTERQRLGTQTAAMRELGCSQGAIQGALRGYMDRMGIEGELPGKLTREQIAALRSAKADAPAPRSDEGPESLPELGAASGQQEVLEEPATPEEAAGAELVLLQLLDRARADEALAWGMVQKGNERLRTAETVVNWLKLQLAELA